MPSMPACPPAQQDARCRRGDRGASCGATAREGRLRSAQAPPRRLLCARASLAGAGRARGAAQRRILLHQGRRWFADPLSRLRARLPRRSGSARQSWRRGWRSWGEKRAACGCSSSDWGSSDLCRGGRVTSAAQTTGGQVTRAHAARPPVMSHHLIRQAEPSALACAPLDCASCAITTDLTALPSATQCSTTAAQPAAPCRSGVVAGEALPAVCARPRAGPLLAKQTRDLPLPPAKY